MNKLITSLILLISMNVNVIAKPHDGMQPNEKAGLHMMKIYKQLELTREQRQTIRNIIKQSREDNSVYKGEGNNIKHQMKALMSLPVWDEELARQTLLEQLNAKREIDINRAEAEHAIYQSLTEEQIEKLTAIKAQQKENRENQQALRFERLTKVLKLSESQQATWIEIHERTKAANKSLAASRLQFQTHKRNLLQAQNFNEGEFRDLLDAQQAMMIEQGLLMIKARFDTKALLTEAQLAKMQKIQKKRKGKGRKADFRI